MMTFFSKNKIKYLFWRLNPKNCTFFLKFNEQKNWSFETYGFLFIYDYKIIGFGFEYGRGGESHFVYEYQDKNKFIEAINSLFEQYPELNKYKFIPIDLNYDIGKQ